MAAIKLIALHINKGKTLLDRIEYAQNPEKTEDGNYISSYECDPKTVHDNFFLLSVSISIKLANNKRMMSLLI